MGDFKLILLIVMVIVLVTVLLYSIIIVSKKKQYYTKIDELDYFKHEISNKTVPFELAKLRSTKKSERIVKMVQQWEQRWGKLEAQFITVTEQIIYAEELVSQRSFSEVDELLEETHQQLEGLNQEVEGLLNEIKELKKSEERSRSNVLGLKEHFEQLKIQYEGEIDQFTEFKEEIKQLFKDIESLFFKFNECMEDCNYDVADETIATIKIEMEKVTIIFDRVPIYLTSIKTEIRPLLKDVLKSYENLTQSGVYLKHLEIEETISIYKEQLSQMTDLIKQFEFEQIETRLMEMSQDAKQMITFMKKELEIQDSLTAGLKEVKESISKMNKQADHLSQRYDNIKSNYTLPEEDEDNFNFILNEVKIITNKYEFLEKNAQQ
ncbi:selenide, water dikinase, partial [Turicibacter sanguinis]|nr:selenide, water dikinase [Turicibacter sanguinis]